MPSVDSAISYAGVRLQQSFCRLRRSLCQIRRLQSDTFVPCLGPRDIHGRNPRWSRPLIACRRARCHRNGGAWQQECKENNGIRSGVYDPDWPSGKHRTDRSTNLSSVSQFRLAVVRRPRCGVGGLPRCHTTQDKTDRLPRRSRNDPTPYDFPNPANTA